MNNLRLTAAAKRWHDGINSRVIIHSYQQVADREKGSLQGEKCLW